MTPAKGDNKDLAEGEDKNYPSRLEELANSQRQALPMNEWPDWSRTPTTDRNQGQGVRPKVRTGQTNRGLEMTLNQQNEPWWSSDLSQLRDQSIAIQNLWISEGRPRHGPTYLERLRVKAAYKRSIRAAKTAFKQAAWVRQNPVSGQKPVATGGNGWQTNQITTQNQNLPNIPRINLHNLPNLPAKPAWPQHNALHSRSLSTISEVPQQSWRPRSPFSLFSRNDARFFMGGGGAAARLQPQSAILRNGEQKQSQIDAKFLLEQAQSRSQPRRRYPAGTIPIWNPVRDVFEDWRKRPQTTE